MLRAARDVRTYAFVSLIGKDAILEVPTKELVVIPADVTKYYEDVDTKLTLSRTQRNGSHQKHFAFIRDITHQSRLKDTLVNL